MTVDYYAQRATQGGLIISEATCISPTAHGYPCTPTLYQPEALEAWRPVVQVRPAAAAPAAGRVGRPAGMMNSRQPVGHKACVAAGTAPSNPCGLHANPGQYLSSWQGIHDKGGRLFMQLWHCGRASHPGWAGLHGSAAEHADCQIFHCGQGLWSSCAVQWVVKTVPRPAPNCRCRLPAAALL